MTIAETILQLYQTGGPVIAVLLLMSVIGLTIILAKSLQFAMNRIHRFREARAAVELFLGGDREAARALVSGTRAPAARLTALAIQGLDAGQISEPRLREELTRVGNDELRALRGGLRPLELIAGLAPLLGLLGTVLGMIEAFQAMERDGSGVSPAVLSGGIWQALSTTAVGLGVAIPAVAALSWLESRVERLGQEMDSLVTRLFTQAPVNHSTPAAR
ncbi:MotA/TolQ/ExbB proton channel family protein [Spiribacter onubensis]|uniref:MotA/TolQ/ExbB proton channel family protein n=1 Tax=Spiribacter onubensis TaxID=3122420 RepID=A0ABV3SAM1_9GAMM